MALIINTAQCQDWYEQNDAFEIKLISLRSYVLFGDILFVLTVAIRLSVEGY